MQITIGEGTGWKQSQVGAAPVTAFNIDFPFFALDDIVVLVTETGTTRTAIRGVDYDIAATPGDDGVFPSGVVNFRSGLTNSIVTLSRGTAVERTANFPLTGFFDRLSLNQQLNRMTAILQELRRTGNSAIRVALEDAGAGALLELPPLSGSYNKTLMFDSTGRPFYGTQQTPGAINVSSFGEALVEAANADAGNSVLGMSAFFKTLLAAQDAATLRGLLGIVDPGAVAPIGTIAEYAGVTEPPNFMFCDGRLLDRIEFSALFAAIGTNHGAGDGSTTFQIPDKRGRVSAGRDDMGGTPANRITQAAGGVLGTKLGAFGGAQSKQLSTNEMPAHNHAVPSQLDPGGGLNGGSGAYVAISMSNGGVSGAAGGGAAFPILPPVYIDNFIIKYQ